MILPGKVSREEPQIEGLYWTMYNFIIFGESRFISLGNILSRKETVLLARFVLLTILFSYLNSRLLFVSRSFTALLTVQSLLYTFQINKDLSWLSVNGSCSKYLFIIDRVFLFLWVLCSRKMLTSSAKQLLLNLSIVPGVFARTLRMHGLSDEFY